MENQLTTELLELKAQAYDISREMSRYNNVLQQINLRIEELSRELASPAQTDTAKSDQD